MNSLKELSKKEISDIKGGGPILEGIAWLYGLAHGMHLRAASEIDWDEVDWEKQQALFE